MTQTVKRWQIDLKVYCQILIKEVPITFEKDMIRVSNYPATSDRPTEQVLPIGYYNGTFEGTEDEFETFLDWTNAQADLKVLGITQIK